MIGVVYHIDCCDFMHEVLLNSLISCQEHNKFAENSASSQCADRQC